MAERRVCVVTGTRADYGMLRPLLQAVAGAPGLRLQLVATGTHLSPAFGHTLEEIRADGLEPDAEVPCLLAGDDALAVAQSAGLALLGLAGALARLRPDVVVLLGDRYEALAAAQAAYLQRLPVAHLAGGDLTEGSLDDGLRHALTKLAHLHFVTHADAEERVLQMGEEPWRVHRVGSLAVDAVLRAPRASREELERELAWRLRPRNLLVSFHPPTVRAEAAEAELEELLAALEGLGPEVGIVLTGSNADEAGLRLSRRLEAFAAGRPHVLYRPSLGQRRYLGLMALADAVVGNSSSGLYEAPSLGTPSVDVGERQRGRPRAASVLHCPPRREAIRAAVERALALGRVRVANPYGDGRAAGRIVAVLRELPSRERLLRKRFQAPPARPLHEDPQEAEGSSCPTET